jgi:hypothetical protein
VRTFWIVFPPPHYNLASISTQNPNLSADANSVLNGHNVPSSFLTTRDLAMAWEQEPPRENMTGIPQVVSEWKTKTPWERPMTGIFKEQDVAKVTAASEYSPDTIGYVITVDFRSDDTRLFIAGI